MNLQEPFPALLESEKRLRAILDTAVEGIVTIDERGLIDSVNPATERIFGYPAAELLGRNVSVLMPEPYRREHDGYLGAYLKTGQAKIIGIGREVVGRRKDGTVFPMDLSVSEVRLGERRLFTGMIRDITDRRRLEKEVLEAAAREQRRIGQDLHDGLGQQLAGLGLMSNALAQSLEAVSPAHAAQAARIAAHIREAIQHTRSLSHGLAPVELSGTGLMSALRQLARNIQSMSGIECVFRCEPPVLLEDNTAATHLFRIAQEAMNNAVKHAGARRIDVVLSGLPERILLGVHDDGRGIPAQPPRHAGSGLRIMQYRAGVLGASLAVQRLERGGTSVVCSLHRNPDAPAPAPAS
jgi:two-component system, LuxR family, sensor kinase FixL